MSKACDIIQILTEAAENPRAQMDKYIAQGNKVVGCFPFFTPEELVHASGMIPIGMWGGNPELKYVKSYLPAFACSVMQGNLELGLRGAYRGMSAVIIPSLCDTFRCVIQDWKIGVDEIPVAPITYPQNRSTPAALEYLTSEYTILLTKLSAYTGMQMTEAALEETMRIYNEHNAEMRKFASIANKHLDIITPRVRHMVMKSAMFYEKAEHTALMKQLNAALEELPEYNFEGKKVILTGIMAEPNELLDLLAEMNIAVVGDDLAQESQQYRTDIPTEGHGTALHRYAQQWMRRKGSSVIHESTVRSRYKILENLCRDNDATGVIFCLMKFCDIEEYNQPYCQRHLAEAGIPMLSVEIDLQNASIEQARTRIETFKEMI